MKASARLPFSEQLRQMMAERDVSVDELAECVEVTTKSIYAWLAGTSKPHPNRLERIAYCLDADEDELSLSLVSSAKSKVLINGDLTQAQIKAQISELRAKLRKLHEGT